MKGNDWWVSDCSVSSDEWGNDCDELVIVVFVVMKEDDCCKRLWVWWDCGDESEGDKSEAGDESVEFGDEKWWVGYVLGLVMRVVSGGECGESADEKWRVVWLVMIAVSLMMSNEEWGDWWWVWRVKR